MRPNTRTFVRDLRSTQPFVKALIKKLGSCRTLPTVGLEVGTRECSEVMGWDVRLRVTARTSELVRCGLKTGAAKGVPLAETTVCVPLTWATRRVPLAGLQECTEGKGSRVGTADRGNQEGTTGGASGVY